MGDTKHTPGPWCVSPFKAWVLSSDIGKDGDLLPVAAVLWPTDERSEAETYANARLVAATPDMDKALNNAAEFLQFYFTDPDAARNREVEGPKNIHSEAVAALSVVSAALATARGTTPNGEAK